MSSFIKFLILGCLCQVTVSQNYVQTQPLVDIRTISTIDCTGQTDSTAGFNAMFANGAAGIDGHEFTLPSGTSCVLRIGATGTGITIRNHMGFKLRGGSTPGDGGNAGYGNFEIQWCQSSGASGATMVDMERVHSFALEGIVFDAHGPVAAGCTTPAGVALNIDLSGAGSLITTFGELHNVSVLGGGYQGGSHDANFKGIVFSSTSGSNVEDMRVYDSNITCATTSPGLDTTEGIVWGPASFNTHEEWARFVNISNCRYGQDLGEGQVFISGGDYSTNGTDFYWRGNAQGGAFIEGIESENSGQFFVTSGLGGGTSPLTIRDSDFEPASFALPSTCGVDLNSAGTIAMQVEISNFNFGPSTVAGWTPWCTNQNSTVSFNNVSFATTNSNVTTSGNAGFLLPGANVFGATYRHSNGGRYRVGSNFAQAGNEDIGFGFFTSLGQEVNGLGYNNSSHDGAQAGGLSIGRDAMYLGTAHLVMKGVWPVPTPEIKCVVNGTPGSTNYLVEIFGKDAAGNRSGWVDYTGNANRCTSAQATFTSTSSLTITWQAVAGETGGYDVVLMNPAAPTTQGWLAGSTSHGTTTLTVTSGPGSFNYAFPNYYDTAQTQVNGERFTNNVQCTFAALPTQPNGSMVYCSDCNATCTAGSSTGRTCFRENGVWTH